MGMTLAMILVVPSEASGGTAGAASRSRKIRLNDLQVVGTHNSYHVEPPPDVLEAITRVDPGLEDLAYTHSPLREQLDDEAVRAVELDVFADPDGSLWRPIGTPGFKVFHLEQVDMDSTCETLVGCLEELKQWSNAHRGHLPIFVLVEPRSDVVLSGAPDPVPITAALLDALDAEIGSVMGRGDVITPDQVRGKHETLEAAVLARGWPRLADARGKFVFLMLGRRNRDQYVVGHPNLEDRLMFPSSAPGQPDAAFLTRDVPIADAEVISKRVRQGYLVRTRADEAVVTPRLGDVTQRDAAFASGAQIVSTDYPVSGRAIRWSDTYVAQLPGGVTARCNPVRAPKPCRPVDVAEPKWKRR
jgi:hypothetical protein